MATRLYCGNATAAPYSPATYRGAWDKTAGSATKLLWTEGYDTANYYTTISTTATANYDVLCYRGVSHKLAAQTISGTFNLCFAIREDNAGMNGYFHVHIYVTQGDSDTPRGTLLSDYVEPVGSPPATEFSTTNAGSSRSLEAAVSLSSLAVSAGDRIVIEIGGRQTAAVASSFTPMFSARADSSTDLVPNAEGWSTTARTWAEFSGTLTWATPIANVTQGNVEAVFAENTAAAAVTQAYADVVMLSDNDPQRVTQVVGELLQAAAGPVRVSQVVAELLAQTVVATRVTQIVAELLSPVVIESRITQAVAELIDVGLRDVRVTQLVVELLGKSSTYCGPPSLSPAALCGKPDVLAWLEWTVSMREN